MQTISMIYPIAFVGKLISWGSILVHGWALEFDGGLKKPLTPNHSW